MTVKKMVLEFFDLSHKPQQVGIFFVQQACYDKDASLIGYEWGFSEFNGEWVRIEGADGSYADVTRWCILPHPQLVH